MAPDNASTTTVPPLLNHALTGRIAVLAAWVLASVGALVASDAFARPGNAAASTAAALSPQPSG